MFKFFHCFKTCYIPNQIETIFVRAVCHKNISCNERGLSRIHFPVFSFTRFFHLNKLMNKLVEGYWISRRESNHPMLGKGDLKSNNFVGRPFSINFPSHVIGLSFLSSDEFAATVVDSSVVVVVVEVVVVVVVVVWSVVLKRVEASSKTLNGRPLETN